ncbi:hypothetical protein [Falsirhodobacter sp. alg1]|uniref:hypothetical protein n=1 Tax=Falsirhodobacter sp. alg1 TaxID=1472418 RepID=UPI00178CBDCE|nr:hypothetical protein [Falsirhodobacter sp. alg1]
MNPFAILPLMMLAACQPAPLAGSDSGTVQDGAKFSQSVSSRIGSVGVHVNR